MQFSPPATLWVLQLTVANHPMKTAAKVYGYSVRGPFHAKLSEAKYKFPNEDTHLSFTCTLFFTAFTLTVTAFPLASWYCLWPVNANKHHISLQTTHVRQQILMSYLLVGVNPFLDGETGKRSVSPISTLLISESEAEDITITSGSNLSSLDDTIAIWSNRACCYDAHA